MFEAAFTHFEGEDAVAYVVSVNAARRNDDESQRAIAARRLATLRQGARTDLQPLADLHEVSSADAAQLMNVSLRLVKSAGAVPDFGTPQLVHAVERGRVKVSDGGLAARWDHDDQREAVRRVEIGEAMAPFSGSEWGRNLASTLSTLFDFN